MDPAKLALLKDRIWHLAAQVPSAHWKCGYCNREVGSDRGYQLPPPGIAGPLFYIRLCGYCNAPTFFANDGEPSPGALLGEPVEHLPPELEALFQESRASAAAGAHTAAVLVCRKMLMHIAVDAKAAQGKSFLEYVNHLASNGYVPPQGKGWVDYIRTRSNEANHEIVLMGSDDSKVLVAFVEMLLKFIYEFPKLVPGTPAAPAGGPALPTPP
jgi:hypothetical protein